MFYERVGDLGLGAGEREERGKASLPEQGIS